MINFFLNILDWNRWKRFFQSSYLLIILAILYIPLITFILFSFNSPSSKQTITTNISLNGFQNYISFFSDSSFRSGMEGALLNSLIIVFITLPISIVIGLLTVVGIWRNYGKGKRSSFFFSNLSISTPDIIQAISFSILFSTILIPLGFNFGFFTIILSHIAFSVPYVVLFLYPKINKLSHNLLYVSYDLKYNFFQTLINVIIPILFPNILSAALMVFALSFDDFIITSLVKGSVPTITSELYNMKNGIKAWTTVFGSLVIILVLVSIILSNMFKTFRKK